MAHYIVEFINQVTSSVEYGIIDTLVGQNICIFPNSASNNPVYQQNTDRIRFVEIEDVKDYTSQLMCNVKLHMNIDIEQVERIIRLLKIIRLTESDNF